MIKIFFHRSLALHRNGSNYLLLLIDVLVLFVIIFDVSYASIKGINILSTDLFIIPKEDMNYWRVLIAVLFFTLMPLVISSVGFFVVELNASRTTSIPWRNVIFLIHCVTTLILTVYLMNLQNFERLSGYYLHIMQTGQQNLEINYKSILSYIGTYGTYLYFIFIVFRGVLFTSNKDRVWRRDLKIFYRLADITSDYMPKRDFESRVVYFNNASMAPDIKWITDRSNEFRNQYQLKLPTSQEGRNYLMEKSNECRNYILYNIVDSEKVDDLAIEFYPGTSRAFEVELCLAKDLVNIIVSPFEHISQKDVIKWHKQTHEINIHTMEWDAEYLPNTLAEKENKLIHAILFEINNKQCGGTNTAILLSEVHYKTGYKIDVRKVIEKIREKHSEIIFYIDGSQAVCNLQSPFKDFSHLIREGDFYYFSAHKWMLSPNTCGVVIKKKITYQIQSYDAFLDKELPTATIDPNLIFGLRASLEFVFQEMTFEKIKMMSNSLKEYFFENLPKELEFVYYTPSIESSFLSVRIKPPYEWNVKNKDELLKNFRKSTLDTTVEIQDDEYWIRLSFSYFIEPYQINNLVKILRSIVKTNS